MLRLRRPLEGFSNILLDIARSESHVNSSPVEESRRSPLEGERVELVELVVVRENEEVVRGCISVPTCEKLWVWVYSRPRYRTPKTLLGGFQGSNSHDESKSTRKRQENRER